MIAAGAGTKQNHTLQAGAVSVAERSAEAGQDRVSGRVIRQLFSLPFLAYRCLKIDPFERIADHKSLR